MTETESRPRNRALVASFLFTDIVGYSKGTASEQYAAKAALSDILGRNLAALSKDDYRIKDTGDGALIAFLVNPEHALYMALAIAHDFAHSVNASGLPASKVRTGLHIGAVKEAIDLESRPNFVGDGINAAQRVMDLAAPGQVTASRAYFEAVSWLDSSYAALFQHLGESNDKHGRPHDLYAVTPSDTVLDRLRTDLGSTTQDARASGDTVVAEPARHADRSLRSPSGAAVSSAASTNSAGERRWLLPVAVVAGVAILSAVAFMAMSPSTTGVASRAAESKSGAATPSPPASVQPQVTKNSAPPEQSAADMKNAATAQSTGESKSALPVQAPAEPAAAALSKPDQAIATPNASDTNVPPSPTTKATTSMRPNTMNAGTGSASAPVSAKSSSPSASAPASGSAPAGASTPAGASAPASARCRHILEKVQVGEPLSQDERRELANSCR